MIWPTIWPKIKQIGLWMGLPKPNLEYPSPGVNHCWVSPLQPRLISSWAPSQCQGTNPKALGLTIHILNSVPCIAVAVQSTKVFLEENRLSRASPGWATPVKKESFDVLSFPLSYVQWHHKDLSSETFTDVEKSTKLRVKFFCIHVIVCSWFFGIFS